MRVLLVQPPYDLFPDDERQAMPPLGLAYIAAALEQAGHDVAILDCVVEGFDDLRLLADGRRRAVACRTRSCAAALRISVHRWLASHASFPLRHNRLIMSVALVKAIDPANCNHHGRRSSLRSRSRGSHSTPTLTPFASVRAKWLWWTFLRPLRMGAGARLRA